VFLFLLLVSCGKDSGPNSPGGADWRLGAATPYTVDSAGQTTITDSVTGRQFLFPDGGHGTLRVSPILSGPAAPYAGEGFNITFDEEVPLAIIIDPAGSDQVMVMGYGTAPGAYDDIPGPSARWLSMPVVDTLDSSLAFQLTLPFTARRKTAQLGYSNSSTGSGFSNYWISSIPAGSDDATRRIGLQLQSSTYVDGVIERLSPARRAAVRAEVDGRLSPYYAWDGFLYSGFWWRSLGSMGRLVHPTIHLKLTANAGNVAHETGHYITHVLVGDDVWSTLEGQAPLWDSGHGIRDAVGRQMLLEDYAYYTEWLTVGTVKSYDLHDPYVIFGGMSPLTSDFPGVEGFAAVMLASLKRTTPSMRSLIGGHSTDVPVIGLSDAQVYDIIAQGATGVESLQERIATAVGADADKLPAIFQRCGWRYSVKGRLRTNEGQPLSGATVSSVSLVGDHVYRGGTSSIPSASDGRFNITGEVFPGESNIRVWDGHDSIDVPVMIPWSHATDETVDLGDLRVAHRVDLAPLRYCSIDLFTDADFSNPSGSYEYYERVEIGPVAGSFIGNQFTGAQDTTDGDVHTVVQLTATVDPQSGDLRTLEVTKARVVSYSDFDWTETLHLTLDSIKGGYSVYPPHILLECSVFEEEACHHISHYTFSGARGDFWQTMTDYNCLPDHANGYVSQARVYFRNEP
jgi:hypothetical protein